MRALAGDPRGGVFGLGSKVWEVNKEAICFLGAGRAALLQLAHPWVAWGVEHHSSVRNAPVERFQRTFRHVFRMVYGDLDTALGAARAVHGVHARITGTMPGAAGPFPAGAPYRANEPAALLWVHATLWDTSVLCYEAVVRRLSLAEKNRYHEETKRFAYLFGIPDAILPPDWPSFAAYVRDMLASDVLTVTPPAAAMARFLFEPPWPGSRPLAQRYAELTAWLLPARLAEGFGLERGGEAGRRRYEATLGWLRALWPLLPRRLRYVPAYVEARRRVAGRTGRDLPGEFLSRLFVGRPTLV